jgi:dienelactone hydrolase
MTPPRALLTLALALLAAGSARAQDCLTGDTLADQRAIVDFRAALDSVCPCDAAATRGIYKHCAKNVLTSTVVAGDLRQECETAMKRLVKNASCGTKKSPCGKVKPSAAVPVSCRVKRATACTDRSSFDQTSCADLDFCNDVVDWTAGSCSDVRVRGPFEAGVRTIQMTKQSVVDPNEPRVLDVVVWYPTTAGAGPINPSMQGVIDAPVDLSGGPYPVLLFSHGSCGYPLQSTFLLPLIASRGYVVIAPPHPGNTIFEFPNCGTPQVQVRSAAERPQDVIFALDQMLAASADTNSPFAGALDPTRIGMSGHSFGGFTTFFVTNQDSRIKVAIPMAPATPVTNASFHVPSLMMLGAIDSVINLGTARQAYANSDAPKYHVEIQHAGHYAFSNLCFPSADCMPPATLEQDEAHLQVLRYVIPFVEWKLGGDERFAAFFEQPLPPGSTLEAVP